MVYHFNLLYNDPTANLQQKCHFSFPLWCESWNVAYKGRAIICPRCASGHLELYDRECKETLQIEKKPLGASKTKARKTRINIEDGLEAFLFYEVLLLQDLMKERIYSQDFFLSLMPYCDLSMCIIEWICASRV